MHYTLHKELTDSHRYGILIPMINQELRLRRLERLVLDLTAILILTPEKMLEHSEISREKAESLLLQTRDRVTETVKRLREEGI